MKNETPNHQNDMLCHANVDEWKKKTHKSNITTTHALTNKCEKT